MVELLLVTLILHYQKEWFYTDAKHLLDGEATNLDTPKGYFDQWIEKTRDYSYKSLQTPDLNEFSRSDIEVLEFLINLQKY